MAKIRVLSENLANQIAAGEVVERPASVVKELIENAIDAGAKKIDVEIESGGRRLIRIADDGEGMSRDDAVLAFERHATSKISRPEDLAAINTLGFRGEALASIASVARVELVTKTNLDLAATRVQIAGGTLIDVRDASRDRGTTVSVRDLFFNTPARRKFLRSEATENYHITAIATHYALANPGIDFRLTNNGRNVLEAPAALSIRERAFQIFGGQLLESLIPVRGGREFVAEVSGFVSAPRERRTNRDSQFFFVNRRYVRDRAIADALRDGYRSILPHGFYPVAFLFIDIPAEEIDVNVHPAKTEVRFRRPEAVKDVVSEAIRQALAAAGIGEEVIETVRAIPFMPEKSYADNSYNETKLPVSSVPDGLGAEEVCRSGPDETIVSVAENLFAADSQVLKPEVRAEIPFGIGARSEQKRSDRPADSSEGSLKSEVKAAILPPILDASNLLVREDLEPEAIGKIRPLGQLHDSFILAADNEGLLLFDQHVAHERILFDKFRNRKNELMSQNLLLPETLDMTPAQAEAFDLSAEELEQIGFQVMRLSGRTIAVRSVPADIPPGEARMLLSEILDNIERERRGSGLTVIRDTIAASMACKAAIKVNNPLTTEEMDWLITHLLTTSSPTTCPHGRPVILRIPIRAIERAFGRT